MDNFFIIAMDPDRISHTIYTKIVLKPREANIFTIQFQLQMLLRFWHFKSARGFFSTLRDRFLKQSNQSFEASSFFKIQGPTLVFLNVSKNGAFYIALTG
jgi:hypothetical protein